MKVYVESVKEESNVYCSTPWGKLALRWKGANPVLHREYDAELEIEDVLFWGREISLSKTDGFAIMDRNGHIVLIGLLESVDEDGYAVLRMGENIIPFIAKGDAPEIGSSIEVLVGTVWAYPVSY